MQGTGIKTLLRRLMRSLMIFGAFAVLGLAAVMHHIKAGRNDMASGTAFMKSDRELARLMEKAIDKCDGKSAKAVGMHWLYAQNDEQRGCLWIAAAAALGDGDARREMRNISSWGTTIARQRESVRDLKLTDKERELGVQKLVDAVAGALGEVDDSCPPDDFIDAVAKRLRAAAAD